MKNSKLFFILLFLVIYIQISSAETFRVAVDNEFGFFSVRSNETYYTDYINKTLYINTGDTIIWENFAYKDRRIILISDEKIFSDVNLAWNTKSYVYTFNKTGTFKFHTKESIFYTFNYSDINVTVDKLQFKTKYQRVVVNGSSNKTSNTRIFNYHIFNNISTYIPQKINITQNNSTINEIYINEIYNNITYYKKYTIIEMIKSLIY